MNPLVSIIIPSYNHIRYIRQTIESVHNQTYHPIELFVIDDGSTDGSQMLLEQLKEEFHFSLICRENKGLVYTLNQALVLAKGDYICVVASDDIFHPSKIETQVQFMLQNSEYAMCFGKMRIIDEFGNFIKNLKSKAAKSGNIFYDIYGKNFITAPTVMIKKEVLIEMGGYSDKYTIEDYPLWLKVAQNYTIGFIDTYLVDYRIHGSNMSGNLLKSIIQTEKVLVDFNIDTVTQKKLSHIYFRWFCDLSKTDHLEYIRHCMVKAFPNAFYKPRFWTSALRYYLNTKNRL